MHQTSHAIRGDILILALKSVFISVFSSGGQHQHQQHQERSYAVIRLFRLSEFVLSVRLSIVILFSTTVGPPCAYTPVHSHCMNANISTQYCAGNSDYAERFLGEGVLSNEVSIRWSWWMELATISAALQAFKGVCTPTCCLQAQPSFKACEFVSVQALLLAALQALSAKGQQCCKNSTAPCKMSLCINQHCRWAMP